jgi:hypothetical protein
MRYFFPFDLIIFIHELPLVIFKVNWKTNLLQTERNETNLYNVKTRYIKVIICQIYPCSITNKVLNYVISVCDVHKVIIHKQIRRSSKMLIYIYYKHLLVMGIGHNFENDDRYTNIDRWSIIGDNYLLNVFTDYNYSNSRRLILHI